MDVFSPYVIQHVLYVVCSAQLLSVRSCLLQRFALPLAAGLVLSSPLAYGSLFASLHVFSSLHVVRFSRHVALLSQRVVPLRHVVRSNQRAGLSLLLRSRHAAQKSLA